MKKRNIKAFTVVELVIVIAVIAVLAAVMIPTFSGIIRHATKAADEAELSAINTNLAIEKITKDVQLYDVIKATYGEEKAANFAPKSAKYGYHYWYDVVDNIVRLGTTEDIAKWEAEKTSKTENSSNITVLTAGGPKAKEPTFSETEAMHPQMLFPGYFLLDMGGSIAGDFIKALRTEEGLEEAANALKDTEEKNTKLNETRTALIAQVEKYMYIGDTVTLKYDNSKIQGVYDGTGNTEGLKEGEDYEIIDLNPEGVTDPEEFAQTVVKVDSNTGEEIEVKGFVLPDSTPVIAESVLTSFDQKKNIEITVITSYTKVKVVVGTETKTEFQNSKGETVVVQVNSIGANITIVVQNENFKQDSSNEGQLVGDAGTKIGLTYANNVESFEVGASGNNISILDEKDEVEDIAGGTEQEFTAVYVPYENSGVTLTTGNFVAVNKDKDLKCQDVKFEVAREEDKELITVDKKGQVFFVKKPTAESHTAYIRVTAVAGGVVRYVKIAIAIVTDMEVTVNNNLVDLKLDTPYVRLDYTGEGAGKTGSAFNFVVGNFTTNTGYPCNTNVSYEYDKDIFTISDGKLTLNKNSNGYVTEGEREVTIKVGPAADPYLIETITVEVKDYSSEPFTPALNYVSAFTYRVGNGNTITLGTLFNCDKIPKYGFTVKFKNKSAGNNGVYPQLPAASGTTFGATYTYNSTDWKQSTIKFSGVGIAVIEIDGVELLTLEVVNGTNYFEGDTLPASASTHIVLLGNVRVRNASEIVTSLDETTRNQQLRQSALSMNNKCLFGNGFVIDATNTTNTALGVISLSNGAMLDNVIVNGAIYTTYEGNSGNAQAWSTSLVFSSNGSIISNSYLANTKSPVRVGAGTTTITNSTISGGCYANVDVRSGSELILENVTLINQVGDTTPSKNALGLGVAVHHNADEAKVIIKGTLKQYNAVSVDNDKNYLPANADDVRNYINEIKSIDPYTVNGKTYNDTGILSMSDTVGDFVDLTEADESVITTHVNKNVASGRYIYHISSEAGPGLYNGNYSYDNTWEQNGYKPNTQGDIPPTYSTVMTTTKPASGAKEYCYLDGSTIKIGFESGGKTLTFSSEVFNITDSLGNKLDLKSITINGEAVSDTYTFNKVGDYTLRVSVEANGKTYTYTLSVNVAITSYKTASISLSSTTATIHGHTSKDYFVVFDILAGVTINDVDENGNARTVTINNTLPNGWTIALDSTGYIVTVTTNWLNVSGEYTTLKITASASGTGEPTNWTLTCDGNKGCPANALHSCYQKAKNNTVSPTATFVYYGFNGQASNSVKLTGSTSLDNNAKHTASSVCVTPDTLVTLADGTQKEIQYVTYEDMLLVWNFYTGEYDVMPASIVMNHGYSNYTVVTLNFSDGTTVNTINGHGFFDVSENKYVIIDDSNVADYLGHEFVKVDGNGYTTVTLESFNISEQYTESWSILTAVQYNCILENMWTLTPAEVEGSPEYLMPYEIGEDMKYDEAKMQADIEKYGLYTYEDFADYCTYEQFVALGLANFKVSVGKGYITWGEIEYLISIHIG